MFSPLTLGWFVFRVIQHTTGGGVWPRKDPLILEWIQTKGSILEIYIFVQLY